MTSLEGVVDSSISGNQQTNDEQIIHENMRKATKRSKSKKRTTMLGYEKMSAIEETAEYTSSNLERHQRHPTHSQKSHTSRTSRTSQLEDQETERKPKRYGSIFAIDRPYMWCIYRVPGKLRKANEAAYTPQLLSIGLFHHGKPELKDMETYKTMYYENFLVRCKKSTEYLKGFIKRHLQDIFRCYGGRIELNADPVNVVLVDACFIFELFLLNTDSENVKTDYILRSDWLRKAVEHELILLENQLPYSFLQDLYDWSMEGCSSVCPLKKSEEKKVEGNGSSGDDQQYNLLTGCCNLLSCSWTHPHDHTISVDQTVPVHDFLKLTCEFFRDYSQGKYIRNGVKLKHFTDLVRHFLCPEENPSRESPEENMSGPKHFTDLIRHFLGPEKNVSRESTEENMSRESDHVPVKSIYDVRKLTAAGVKFRPLEDTVRFVIKKEDPKFNLLCFRTMELKLTQFIVTYTTECVIRNVMALEQILYPDKPYICSYFLLMDQLVDTVEDVNLLIEKQIIVNLLGSNKAVMKLVNSLCEQIKEDKTYYYRLCGDLNKHYENNKGNRSLAILRQVYFKDLWTSSSTVLGIVVLLFSVVGTIKSLMS